MRLQEVIERALALSRADACVVIARETSAANVRWANNSATTNGETQTQNLHVVSIADKRVGAVSNSYFPDQDLEGIVRASEAAAQGKPPAEDFMDLPDAGESSSDWDDGPEPTGVEVFGQFAPRLGETFERGDASGVKLFGYADHSATTVYLGTTSGVRRRFTGLSGSAQINAKTPDFALSAWAGRTTKTFRDVDVHDMYDGLSERLMWSKECIDVAPGHYEVILQPSPVADMVVWAHRMSTLRDADEGRSAFAKPGGGNRVGETLYPGSITIYSDPHEADFEVAPFVVSPASTPGTSVFDNGLPLRRTEWVAGGELRALVSTRHWAGVSGVTATPAIDNLVFTGDGPTLDEMIASTTRALLVTSFFYIRMLDPQTMLLTGLTRDGVFLIEDGEVRGAVNNFRFNMSPVRMLAQTVEVGRSEAAAGRGAGRFMKMPPIRVENFHLSTVSQAT